MGLGHPVVCMCEYVFECMYVRMHVCSHVQLIAFGCTKANDTRIWQMI